MSRIRILLADNKPHFRATRADFLKKNERYEIIEAGSSLEARRALAERSIHLAILDQRLDDDDDELDISGILLAEDQEFSSVPKLILTAFPSSDGARKALNQLRNERAAAVDYLEKTDGPEKMLEAVEQALARYVRINFDLRIEYDERQQTSLTSLISRIDNRIASSRQLGLVEELIDLLRRLFYDWELIKIGRAFWQDAGRVAIAVYAFSEKKRPEWFFIVCGQKQGVMLEARKYDSFAPKASGLNGTIYVGETETTNFAARSYLCAEADLETVKSMAEMPLNVPEKTLNVIFGSLFEALANWRQGVPDIVENKSLGQLYCEKLGLYAGSLPLASLEQKLDALIKQLARLQIYPRRAGGELSWRFKEEVLTGFDPLQIFRHPPDIGQPLLVSFSPGRLPLQSILTDGLGKIWLTEFAGAGQAPQYWNFVALEAALRFDRVETENWQWLLEMERALCDGDFRQPNTSDSEGEVKQVINAISKIRGFTDRNLAANPASYHLGLFFQALKRLAEFDPAAHLSERKLTRFSHLLLATTMLSRALSYSTQDRNRHKEIGIRIDRGRHEVCVNGKLREFYPRSYDILCYLYDNAGTICSRKKIIEEAFKLDYNDKNQRHMESVNDQLDSAIYRLRQDLGEGQIYLKTVRGAGYMLDPSGIVRPTESI